MPPRSIANATISFGLVSVPVNLYSSSESKSSVSFNMLHKKCNTRLKQQYTCPKDNEIVGRDDTVKGYEFAKDQYVVFTPEELKALDEKATGMIEVVEFVPLEKVDREYVDKVYYLGPDKGGDRAYRLLCEALRQTGRAALGQYAARGGQTLVLNGGAIIDGLQKVANRITLGTAWACNVVRVLPQRGVQAFSIPAGVEPLLFYNLPDFPRGDPYART